jgi:hypothetical protein
MFSQGANIYSRRRLALHSLRFQSIMIFMLDLTLGTRHHDLVDLESVHPHDARCEAISRSMPLQLVLEIVFQTGAKVIATANGFQTVVKMNVIHSMFRKYEYSNYASVV